jgi:hypothetical protein
MAKPSPTHSGNPLLIAIGEAVRAERTALGMSQEMPALEAELDRSSMSVVSSAVNIT